MWRSVLLLVSATLGATTLLAVEPAVHQSADGSVVLTVTERGVRVDRDGGEQEITLPAGASLSGVRPLADGWLLTGTADGERSLLLVASDGVEPMHLREPATARGALKRSPTPLISGATMAGLAWLEGDRVDRLGVQFAERRGDRWGVSTVISPPGPGTQTALAATTLADGSWLLVWSANDGEDDEILWARGRANGWTQPRRVHGDNRVPDIVPAVVAAGDGALLAWSRYDGNDYRVVVSRLVADEWTPPETAGERGSTFPQWVDEPTGRFLLYRRADPGAWIVARTDERGAQQQRWSVPSRPGARPALLVLDEKPTLRFADGTTVVATASAAR